MKDNKRQKSIILLIGVDDVAGKKTYKEVITMIDVEWLKKAIDAIKTGLCDKLEKGSVIVYKCGKIIRIDIKI